MALGTLPTELYEGILCALRPVDLARLSRVSRRLHAVVKQALWSHVCFLSQDGTYVGASNSSKVNSDGRLPRPGFGSDGFVHCKGITIASPRPHWTASQESLGSCPSCSSSHGDRGAGDAPYTVHGQLRRLRPDSLHSFSWLLGVCIPANILGSAGALALQRTIEDMTLVTGYDRLGIRCLARNIDLSPFSNLRKLSWIGVHSVQLAILKRTLAAVSDQLTHLELDFLSQGSDSIRWAPASDPLGPSLVWEEGSTLDESLLSQPSSAAAAPREGQAESILPNLVSLSLTNTTITSNGIADRLNLAKLESLKLRRCPGWHYMLQDRERKSFLKLRCFELHQFQLHDRQEAGGQGTSFTLSNQLERLGSLCPDLTDVTVYAVTPPARNTTGTPNGESASRRIELGLPWECMNTVLSPLATWKLPAPGLRRLVCHVQPTDGFHEIHNVRRGDGVSSEELIGAMFPDMKLDFFGVLAPLKVLAGLFRATGPSGRWSRLRVLHIRQDHDDGRTRLGGGNWATGFGVRDFFSPSKPASPNDIDLERMLTPEFYELAKSLFSDDGMSSLRVLAFGDFASLDPAGRLVLCRAGAGFRLLREDDGEALSTLEVYADSLLAGPDYSKPFLRTGGASMSRSVWRKNLVARIARESACRGPTIPGSLLEEQET